MTSEPRAGRRTGRQYLLVGKSLWSRSRIRLCSEVESRSILFRYDQLSFFQLLEKDVGGLRAETAGAAAEYFAAMFWLAEHGERPEIVAVAE